MNNKELIQVALIAVLVYFIIQSISNKREKYLYQEDSDKKLVVTDSNGNLSSINMQLVRGMILIWRGEIKDIPQGWALCDGKNDTPDLSGRFVIGINPSDNRTESKDENDIQLNPRPYNSIGGRQTVTLSVEQMPNHSHQTGGNITSDMSGSKYGGIVTRYRSGLYTDAVGGNQPHDNMPPYYALAYIMKL